MSYSLIQSEGNDCYKSYVAHSLIQSEGNDCYKSYVAQKWYKVYPVKLTMSWQELQMASMVTFGCQKQYFTALPDTQMMNSLRWCLDCTLRTVSLAPFLISRTNRKVWVAGCGQHLERRLTQDIMFLLPFFMSPFP